MRNHSQAKIKPTLQTSQNEGDQWKTLKTYFHIVIFKILGPTLSKNIMYLTSFAFKTSTSMNNLRKCNDWTKYLSTLGGRLRVKKRPDACIPAPGPYVQTIRWVMSGQWIEGQQMPICLYTSTRAIWSNPKIRFLRKRIGDYRCVPAHLATTSGITRITVWRTLTL